MLLGERIGDTRIPEAWLQCLGSYEKINAGDDTLVVDRIRLRCDAGLLIMEYALPLFSKGEMSVAMSPLNGTEALILGLGLGMGETIRSVNAGGGSAAVSRVSAQENA